ncbi:MAG TPA: hypothetical protein VM242_11015 [Acidimicrobiales bacterium]|jgi:hypothetical protein|nr:hypothetical protein [Acidimicrobiales bacterium]
MMPGSLRATKKPWGHLWLALPALAAFLAGWAAVARDGGSLLDGVVRTVASALLMGAAAGVAHLVVEQRNAERHASIRAEIAASGGLRHRLMV